MKKLIDKFNSLWLPVKLMIIIAVSWVIPFVESAVIGATDYGDLSIFSLILLGIGLLVFTYMAYIWFFRPIGGWLLWKIGIIKKKK